MAGMMLVLRFLVLARLALNHRFTRMSCMEHLV